MPPLPSDVILPKGTPTISRPRRLSSRFHPGPGIPPFPVTVEFQVTVTRSSWGKLRKLAKLNVAEEPRKK